MNNGDKPAFEKMGDYNEFQHYGLTKREHFAAMAMQGLIANPGPLQNADSLSITSVEIANALLKALEQ